MAQLTRIGEGDLGALPGQDGGGAQQQGSVSGGYGGDAGRGAGGRSSRGSGDTDKAYQRMMEERNSEMQNNTMNMRR